MVERLEPLGREIPWRANGFADDVVFLAAGWDALKDDIGDAGEQPGGLVAGGSGSRVEALDSLGEVLDLGQQGGLVGSRRGRDLLAEGLLLRPRGLELGQ